MTTSSSIHRQAQVLPQEPKRLAKDGRWQLVANHYSPTAPQ